MTIAKLSSWLKWIKICSEYDKISHYVSFLQSHTDEILEHKWLYNYPPKKSSISDHLVADFLDGLIKLDQSLKSEWL